MPFIWLVMLSKDYLILCSIGVFDIYRNEAYPLMNQAFSTQYPARYANILPWLHFLGAVTAVVLHALYSAVHSDLGYEISAGESPGFAWIRAHVNTGMGFELVYLIAVCRLQLRQLQHLSTNYARLLKASVGLELLCIAAIGPSMYYHLLGFLLPISHSSLDHK